MSDYLIEFATPVLGDVLRYLSHVKETSKTGEIYYLYTIQCVDINEKVTVRIPNSKRFKSLEQIELSNLSLKTYVEESKKGYSTLRTIFIADDIFSVENK